MASSELCNAFVNFMVMCFNLSGRGATLWAFPVKYVLSVAVLDFKVFALNCSSKPYIVQPFPPTSDSHDFPSILCILCI